MIFRNFFTFCLFLLLKQFYYLFGQKVIQRDEKIYRQIYSSEGTECYFRL